MIGSPFRTTRVDQCTPVRLCFAARVRMARAPPPYIAPKPLAPLGRRTAKDTAPQHLPQHTARDQAAEAPSSDLLDAHDGAVRELARILPLPRDIQHNQVAVPRRLGINPDVG